MSVMFVLHSKKALSDILEGMTLKNFSFAPLPCLVPFVLSETSALTLLVIQFSILQVFRGECYKYLEEDPDKNCLVSQRYFVASELRPAVVFNFVFQRPRGSHSRLLPGVSF